MHWLQLRINSSAEKAQTIDKACSEAGALAITFEDNADQAIFEPDLGETPLWNNTRVIALFSAEVDTTGKLQEIQTRLSEPLDNANWHILEDKDWEREWMQHFKPIQCADNLWICPSWIDPPEPRATNLLLDPGLAFGTGTHPTTFLCMAWLASQNLTEMKLIDYGCGSGILGVASLLLGAAQVSGVDIDPQALLATQENTRRNNIKLERFPVYFPKQCPEEQADIVLANILAGPLVSLVDTLADLLNPGGLICLSGVLQSQYSMLEEAYKDKFTLLEVQEKDSWICISGRKR